MFQHGGRRVTEVGSSAATLHCFWDTRRLAVTQTPWIRQTLPDMPNLFHRSFAFVRLKRT
jgi:hypothetical protein